MGREGITRETTLGEILDEAMSSYPEGEAIVYPDRDYRQTWEEFGQTVDRVAKGLMALGVEKGEKVAIWATNVPHWVTLQFATARIGAILLTVNINYKSTEMEYLLRQSEAENVFVMDGYRDTDFLQVMYELVPELREMPRDQLRSTRFPHLKRVFFLGPEKHRGMFSLPEVMSAGVQVSEQEYRKRREEVDPHDVVNMQYTSGTTGFPKGVMLTHHNIVNNGYWVGEYQNLGPGDRVCIPVPLFHCFGCVLGVLACANHASTMVILERFDPVNGMMAVERERCTALYGVPTMFMSILDHPLFPKFDFSSLRTGIMAGSSCPVRTMNQCVERMNMSEVTIVYGLTEASPGMTQTRYDEPDIQRKCSTVGQAMPGVEVVVIDPETGDRLGPGRPGELCCRGYNVMKGYYNMPEETSRTIDQEGWLHSGDIGVVDEQGYFSVTGRLKDMIIRGGENIYPKEVEEFIRRMAAVQDVQVVGVPSQKYGEEVGAFIIPRSGVEIEPTDAQDYCRGKIAWHKIPKYVHLVDSFPLTASGKVQKFRLREMAEELWPDV